MSIASSAAAGRRQILRSVNVNAVPFSDTVGVLMQQFAATAAERDHAGGTPKAERDHLRRSGLLAMVIPRAHGGLGASWRAALEVVRAFAQVDSSVAHLFGFHHLMLATVRLFGTPSQWEPWYENTARRDWFWGNALNPLDRRTLSRRFGGWREFSGRKSFCSGAIDSEMLIASANEPDREGIIVAAVPTARTGISVCHDWDNIGQRQTDSGSVNFDKVRVDETEVLVDPGPLSTPRSCLRPLIAQNILTNIYVGIAEGAFEDARHYTLKEARPWHVSGVARTDDDPYVLAHYGDFLVGLESARVLANRAADALDEALAEEDALTERQRGALAVSTAVAKVASTRIGLDLCSRMFDVTGARATHASLRLDRHWRNLRTHTLHDPVDYKIKELGEFVLKGKLPTPSFYS
jgi:alkylation response protein AidB-like acyl-CoA dehydrogenase